MTPATCALILFIGLCIGTVGGMIGIGGGILVIPVLMMFFGFTQPQANGTSLAMLLPPIGIFAVLAYARAGNVNWPYAWLLAAGFAVGAYVGARLVTSGVIHPTALRFCFAFILLYCAGRILFPAGGRARSALEVSLLFAAFTGTYLIMRLFGRKLSDAPGPWGWFYRKRLRESTQYDYEI